MEIINITKAFNDNTVLRSFSCSIPDCGITVLKGASGKGKTTLARIIAGLEKPDSGSLHGFDEKKISMMFQEDRLFPHMTALENVSIVSNKEKALEILTAFGLQSDMTKRPEELSGGMCRRVSLARALAFGGDIIILDEPFKGLDPETKENVFKIVKQYAEASAVLIITHDLDDIKNADKIISLI